MSVIQVDINLLNKKLFREEITSDLRKIPEESSRVLVTILEACLKMKMNVQGKLVLFSMNKEEMKEKLSRQKRFIRLIGSNCRVLIYIISINDEN